MKLKKQDLLQIKAGAKLTGTLVNSLIRGINVFTDIGRYLGSSIRRIVYGKVCPL